MKTKLSISVLFFIILFHSCQQKDEPLTPPVLTTTAATEITFTTAIIGGEIKDIGGAYITARGVCWNTSVEPTTDSNKTSEPGGLGVFTSNLSQLTPNTMYYARAYGINSAGTAYGNEVAFKTSSVEVPVLTTQAATNITQTTVQSGGNITDDKGGSVSARGICWSTESDPTILDSNTIEGAGSGSFSSNITQLTPNTLYYLRAYAINSVGTGYGNQVTFTTSQVATATLTTTEITLITQTTAVSGGNITAENGGSVTSRGVCWGTTTNPTIENSKTSDGSGAGAFTSSIIGLAPNTTYYVRAYATNSAGTEYGSSISLITQNYGAVTDIDNNVYKTITIGTQVWMEENLKTITYNDGTAIPNITVDATWSAANTGAYCDFINTPAYSTTYGRLYNWYAVDNNAATMVTSNGGKNVCPTGWHVPSAAEWTTLTDYLGGFSVAGGKLKETGTTHWINVNTGATNESGFTALPGGYRYSFGPFDYLGLNGGWWSTTEHPDSPTYNALPQYMSSVSIFVFGGNANKKNGLSVRCVKDN